MTELITVSKDNPEKGLLARAASIIRDGGTVAFPTETVYGLGANALDPRAVKKIFIAKGRPQDNPLIVHIAEKEMVYKLSREVPEKAKLLIDAFWPGPMTLVMKKQDIIPNVITAGLDSVGIRMPSNPVALAFIRECDVPIAAPSANTSGKPSPTEARHVYEDLNGKIDAIIDGGGCSVGVESTVVDMTQDIPVILRPGGITFEQLKDVVGEVKIDLAIMEKPSPDLKPKAPGMKYKHYSPKAEVYIATGTIDEIVNTINNMAQKDLSHGKKVGIMATVQTYKRYKYGKVMIIGDREDAISIARSLFNALREFDEMGVDIIYAEAINQEGIGLAIMNRLLKAAGYKII